MNIQMPLLQPVQPAQPGFFGTIKEAAVESVTTLDSIKMIAITILSAMITLPIFVEFRGAYSGEDMSYPEITEIPKWYDVSYEKSTTDGLFVFSLCILPIIAALFAYSLNGQGKLNKTMKIVAACTAGIGITAIGQNAVPNICWKNEMEVNRMPYYYYPLSQKLLKDCSSSILHNYSLFKTDDDECMYQTSMLWGTAEGIGAFCENQTLPIDGITLEGRFTKMQLEQNFPAIVTGVDDDGCAAVPPKVTILSGSMDAIQYWWGYHLMISPMNITVTQHVNQTFPDGSWEGTIIANGWAAGMDNGYHLCRVPYDQLNPLITNCAIPSFQDYYNNWFDKIQKMNQESGELIQENARIDSICKTWRNFQNKSYIIYLGLILPLSLLGSCWAFSRYRRSNREQNNQPQVLEVLSPIQRPLLATKIV